MPLHCTTTFTCDRNGVEGVSEGDTLQSNPPQGWLRLGVNRMVGVTMQSSIVHLCPDCARDFDDFMGATRT